MGKLLSLIKAGGKPVIGMVQLDALAGSSRYTGGGIDGILRGALDEARLLAENGVDALMVQNLGDLPVASSATSAQVAWMTRATTEICSSFGGPVGLNLLENDAEAMFAVASAAGADFVRIKVYVGAMLTPFGIESGQAFAAIRARNACYAMNVAIFADVHDRTGVPLASGGFAEDLDYAVRLGGADGLVLTGKSYGQNSRTDWNRAQATRRRPDPCRRRRHRDQFCRSRSGRRWRHRQFFAQRFGRTVRQVCSGENTRLHGGGRARSLADMSTCKTGGSCSMQL